MLKNIAFLGVSLILFGLTKGFWFDGFPLENMPIPTGFPWPSAVPGDAADSTTIPVNTSDTGTATDSAKEGFSENSTSPETAAGTGPSAWPATTADTGPTTRPAKTAGTGPTTRPATTAGTGPTTRPATTADTGPTTRPATSADTGPTTRTTWHEFITLPEFTTNTEWHGSTMSLDCPPSVDLANYTGNISVANNGEVCQEWSGFGQLILEVSQVPTTVIQEAKNYCRNFLWSPIPWCFVSLYESDLCHRRICEVVPATVASADTLSGSESTVPDGTSAVHNATTGAGISDENKTSTTAGDGAAPPTDGSRGKFEDLNENSCETVHQVNKAVVLLLDIAMLLVLS